MKILQSVLDKFKTLSEAAVGTQDIRKEVLAVLTALKPVILSDIQREVARQTTLDNIKSAFVDGGYASPPKDMVEAFYAELSGPGKSAPKAPRAKKADKPVVKPAVGIPRPVASVPVAEVKADNKPQFSFQN